MIRALLSLNAAPAANVERPATQNLTRPSGTKRRKKSVLLTIQGTEDSISTNSAPDQLCARTMVEGAPPVLGDGEREVRIVAHGSAKLIPLTP